MQGKTTTQGKEVGTIKERNGQSKTLAVRLVQCLVLLPQ